MECIFCKIINKEIPSYIIYEDDNTLAFLDISQTTLGHTLVVPKNHCETIYDNCDTKFLEVIPMIAKHLKNKLNASGINIVNNSGEVAGQTVNHLHFHIIPRYDDYDTFSIKYTNNTEKVSNENFMRLKEKLEVL